MGNTVLIEAIVRQTTILLATLATETGNRASLARVANEVFASLVAELKQQGVGNRVIADMFGMALRTYHHRLARLAESRSEQGSSLWEAVLRHVQEQGPVLRADVLARFRHDDEATVKGVLRDLVDSSLISRSGQGDARTYRPVAADEQTSTEPGLDEVMVQLVLVAVHRHAPADRDAIGRVLPLDPDALDALLARLVADGRLTAEPEDGVTRYRHDRVFIPVGDAVGWQAAVFDHYQAMVSAVCAKLRAGRARSAEGESVGGSTYHFDLWDGHPLEREVTGFLQSLRRQAVGLREAVEQHNRDHARPDALPPKRVVAYVGQAVFEEEEGDDA